MNRDLFSPPDIRGTFRLYLEAFAFMSIPAALVGTIGSARAALLVTPILAILAVFLQHHMHARRSLGRKASSSFSLDVEAVAETKKAHASAGVTAIVLARNDEMELPSLIRTLRASEWLSEIIVVSSGSADDTVAVARQHDEVRVIALRENHGLGFAMRVGLDAAKHPVVFFVEANLTGLNPDHVVALTLPVIAGQTEMNVGVVDRGMLANFLHLKLHVAPVLSSTRVMREGVFEQIPINYLHYFSPGFAVNFFTARAGFRQQHTILDNCVLRVAKPANLWTRIFDTWQRSRNLFLLFFDLYVFESWRWVDQTGQPPAVHEDEFLD